MDFFQLLRLSPSILTTSLTQMGIINSPLDRPAYVLRPSVGSTLAVVVRYYVKLACNSNRFIYESGLAKYILKIFDTFWGLLK